MSDARWEPDPTRRFEQRYWDGEHWTDHVASGGVTSTDPLDAATADGAAVRKKLSTGKKVGIGIGAAFVALLGIGALAPPEDKAEVAVTGATSTTSEGASTTKATTTSTPTKTSTTAVPTTTIAVTRTAKPATTVAAAVATTAKPTATARPVTTTASPVMTTAPAPPAGQCSASVSDPSPPSPGGDETVSITSNRPSTGFTVVAHYKSKDSSWSSTTNGTGAGSVTFTIGSATPGYQVNVSVSLTGGGGCSTSFTPRAA